MHVCMYVCCVGMYNQATNGAQFFWGGWICAVGIQPKANPTPTNLTTPCLLAYLWDCPS